MSENKLLLNIGILTYNHEKFIAKAIDSILMQKVNFDYNIIISDDASTDKTQDILKDYQKKYPDKINLIFSEKNQGVFKSAEKIINSFKAKYIAILEGDDYWIYDKKLQTQIDFLETNPDYNGCFHDAKIINTEPANKQTEEQSLKEFKYYSQSNKYKSDFYPQDLVQRNIIPTGSFVFRNKDLSSFIQIFKGTTLSLSWAVELFIIKNNKFKYFNELWSVYNEHSKGVSKTKELNAFKKSNIEILKKILNYDYYKFFRKDVYKSISNEYLQILLNPKTNKYSKKDFRKILFQYFCYSIKAVISELRYFRKDYKKKYLSRRH
jgi:glycosyltransferase involved in cell wall biosynthesis